VKTLLKTIENKLALAGFIFILICLFIAIPGYLITPDSTPMANDMHLEIVKKKPGFKALFLIKPYKEQKKSNWWRTLAHGREKSSEAIFLKGSDGSISEFQLSLLSNEMGTAESQKFHAFIQAHEFNKKLAKSEWNLEIRKYRFGTDGFGNDLLSRMMIGTRISLSVGFISVFISFIIGTFLGLVAGYYRGWVDKVVMWLVNVIWSLPTLLLVVALTFALGKGFWQIFVAVGLSMWVELARIVRGQVLSIREREYVQAAQVMGFSNRRILWKHILPNISGPIIVICAANFASAILLEAGLSFLGLGVQPPMPSWGQILKDNFTSIVWGYEYLSLIPGVAIMLLVMSFNFIGTGLRDALDVKMN
jgi:peptide/nickel transport system permease protein